MVKQHLLGVLLASFSLLQASQVEALALGRLQVISAQQEPMLVELSLAETQGVIAAAVKPRLATAGEYQVAGIDYQDWFEQIRLQVVERDEQLYVQAFSSHVVTQSELDLLIEVEYIGGRLLGQFQLSFDKAQESTAEAESTPTPTQDAVVLTSVETSQIESVIAQVTSAPTPKEEAAPKPAATPAVVVKVGQTLWRVAVENSPSEISPWQSIMAIYSSNPKAFKDGRITHLMAGSKISVPTVLQMQSMSAKQAKSAYERLVASYKPKAKPVAKVEAKAEVKEEAKPAIAVVKPPQPSKAELQAQQQAQQQLQKVTSTLAKLEGQSESLQQQLESLEAARSQAKVEAQTLQDQNQELAQGLESQQQSLQTLSKNKQVLQADLNALGQQVGVTEQDLHDKQLQLQVLEDELKALAQKKQSLANLQQAQATAAPSEPVVDESATDKDSSITVSKQLYPWLMGALVVLMLGLVFSLLWRWLNRKSAPKVAPSEPPMQDRTPDVVLDPLADYDAKPSTQSQHLHNVSERMELNEQASSSEAGFIEQLLQEQGTHVPQGRSSREQDDTLHLSAEVEAMLKQQRAGKVDHEPQQVGSSEDDMYAKLDLARSYKEMGQIDQAQALLQEVLHAGNLEQQTDATLLLSRMRQD